MKTLVVLSALASLAIAAPALQEDKLETHHVPEHHIQAHPRIPELMNKEKKLSSEHSTSITSTTGTSNTEIHTEAGSSTLTSRSNTMKKPLIVKKKFGYSLYRDSEEEKANADSNETCGRQVRVKVCDEIGKFKERSNNVHSADDDMKLSIKMAKEAVENLQRDLMNMEHKNVAMKMAHDTESDSDLHGDIEVARQALEHIHSNFENFETMRLHATASRDSETMHDVHITMAKSEEEKMAQWKEAINNIQKNVEIVRNIEDSFKSANNQESLVHLDQSESASIKHEHQLGEDGSHVALTEEHHLRDAATPQLDIHQQLAEHELKKEHHQDKDVNEHLSMDHAREEHHTEDDMNPSASEAIEMKTVDIENHHTLRSENHQHHDEHQHEKNAEEKLDLVTDVHNNPTENLETIQEHHQLARNVDLEHDAVLKDLTQHQHLVSSKEAEDITKNPKEEMEVHTLLKSAENIADSNTAPSTTSVKVLLPPHVATEHQRNTIEAELDEKSEHEFQHETTLNGAENLAGFQMKLADHPEEDKKVHHETKLGEVVSKTADNSDVENHHSSLETKAKEANQSPLIEVKDKENKDHAPKSVQEIHIEKLHNIAEQNENFMKAAEHSLHEHQKHQKIDYNESDTTGTLKTKSAEDHSHHHLEAMKIADDHLHHHLMAMKAADHHVHHYESAPANGHWMNEHKHMASMKAAEDLKDLHGLNHNMRNSYHSDHQFNPSKMGGVHDFEMSEHAHHHAHVPNRYHHNLMAHSNMHEMNMHDMNGMSGGAMASNFNPSMRDAMDGFESEHTYRWMPSHESARNAYGAGLSGGIGSSGGAVGVFPNANTGGCGIPLLLSCSPSVVSGSLAKTHLGGSYSSPSYRTEEDFTFHNKRDIKKTNDERGANVLRKPFIVKQKTVKTMEKKL